MSVVASTRHFDLHQLADGVFAAINTRKGVAGANAGVIDLGDQVVVFDTFVMPQAIRELVRVMQDLIPRPISLVINSHWHHDHLMGNQVFPSGVPILATCRTYEMAAEKMPDWIRENRVEVPGALADCETQLESETDAEKRAETAEMVEFYQMVMQDLPSLELRLPNMLFEGRMILQGSRRRVEIMTFSGGHTESDMVLYLPGDGIAFMADLLFVGYHPGLSLGDPQVCLRAHEAISALDPPVCTVVPGHGTVGVRESLTVLRDYIDVLVGMVRDCVAQGGSADDVIALPIPEMYQDWVGDPQFPDNLRYVYSTLQSVDG